MAMNYNVVLRIHEGLPSIFCTTSLIRKSITFYIEARQNNMCRFKAITCRIYSDFEMSQFLTITFAVLLLEYLLNIPIFHSEKSTDRCMTDARIL